MAKMALVHIRFEPAKGGGAISHTLMRGKPSGQGSMGPEEDHMPMIHPTMAHAVKHMKSVMSACWPQKESAEPDEQED